MQENEVFGSLAGWKQEAENWVAWARKPQHDEYHRYRDAFFDDVVPAPGAATLEIGCGEGRVSRDLRDRGHRVTGIDAVATLVAAARDVDPVSTYVEADATALPFDDEVFDLVVAHNSLMDVDDMPATVREAARVLRHGGRFAIAVTHPVADAGTFDGPAPDASFLISNSYYGKRRVGDRAERNGLEMTFHGYAYALEDYWRAFEAAGLLVELLREPQIPQIAIERDAAEARWRRIPAFLHLRMVKR
jgi:SAM-dependent methyltransferase